MNPSPSTDDLMGVFLGVDGLLFAMQTILQWKLDQKLGEHEEAIASLDALVEAARQSIVKAKEATGYA